MDSSVVMLGCLSNQLAAKYVAEAFERGWEGEVYLKVNITISRQGKQPEVSWEALAARQRRDYTQASGLCLLFTLHSVFD